MQRVLICDDEPDLAALVELNLKDAGFAVEVAHTGEAALETRTVDTHMMRLRDKVGAARDQVETVRGVGYRLSADEAPTTPGATEP